MRKYLGRVIASAVFIVGVPATSLHAQVPVEPNAGRATELGGAVAAAVTSSETAPAVAGTVDWSLTRWIAIEARGSWFARGHAANGVGADVGALINLVAKRPVTPYVNLAFGLYRENIDMPAAEVSPFYRARMNEGQDGVGTGRTFTDPAWRVGAGVDIISHRHISIRPEASVILVHRQGATDTITTVGIRLGYRFEDHPVTPSVR
jgi:Outer membrane protein beta-barrel domain